MVGGNRAVLVAVLVVMALVAVSCSSEPPAHKAAVKKAKVRTTTTTTSTTLPPPTTTFLLPTTTEPLTTTSTAATTTTQPAPEGTVQFGDVQAQTFGYYDTCKDVSFEANNASNTTVIAVSVMFTMTEYSADGSFLDPGPTQGPSAMTVYLLPGAQQQLDVQVCPHSYDLLPAPGDYMEVTGVSGTFTWDN
jgi:hypothetical protein